MPQPPLSETYIVNLALVRIGARPINDIGDTSTDKGAAAAILYYQMRDALLRRLRWNFARVFTPLAQLATAPLNLALLPDPDYAGRVVYTGAYQLPADFLRLSAVSPFDAHWRVVGNTLYTDAAQAASPGGLIGLQPSGSDGSDNMPTQGSTGTSAPVGIEYIARITDVTRMEPLFVDVLSRELARDLCFGNNALAELRQQLAQEAKEK